MTKRGVKGQVTFFIILGIVLLLALAGFIVFQKELSVFKPEIIIPPEVAPLQRFVENCVDTTMRDGIEILAANGGFIRFPDEILLDPKASIESNPFFPEFRVPLWRYNGITKIPTEAFIEQELAYYLTTNINTCLNDLETFEEQFILQKGEITAIIELVENGVNTELVYPLKIIQINNQTTTFESFKTLVPLRLKTVYGLAKKVMEEENTDLFLERTTIDLLALDPQIPYTDLVFTCSTKTWKISDISDKIKHLLRTDLPLIRVDKTSYIPVPQNRPYEANHFVWEVTSLKYPSTHVSFTYDDQDYPFDLYIRPNVGNTILQSNAQRGQELLSAVCIQLWHFTYDIKYPVLVTVQDDAEKGHEALTFNFGMQIGIKSNRADTSNFGISTFDANPTTPEEEFCDIDNQNLLTVHTFENVSTPDFGDLVEELPEVNLSFTCLRMKCPLGQTEWQFRGAVARATELVPYCVNGILKGNKEGYAQAQQFVTTNEEKTVSLYLTPTIKKNISVVKHYQFTPNVEERLKDEENIIITIKRPGFSSTGLYPPIQGVAEIELLAKWDYTYEVTLYLADDSGIIGGYKANWTPSWTELQNAKEIEFHVLERPYTEDPIEQYQFIQRLEEDSKELPLPKLR